MLDALWGLSHHLFHSAEVRDVIARNERILDVFVEIVYLEVRHRSDAALCFGGIGFFNRGFTHEGHLTFARGGHLKGVTHSGHSGTNYQKSNLRIMIVANIQLFNLA